ncbi:MAG: hypothetical protein QG636_451 [Patescibacteria group bacterium]|nr:hypothetical protein [Patescibacteria group bacterium]
MSKSRQDGSVDLAVPTVMVVVISLLLALAASKERPQQSQSPLEAAARTEAALKRGAMP